VVDIDLDRLRRSYLKNAKEGLGPGKEITGTDIAFLAADTKTTEAYVRETMGI
jgi:hypothetical protein